MIPEHKRVRTRYFVLQHVPYVHFPDAEPGVIYMQGDSNRSVHFCACGCGGLAGCDHAEPRDKSKLQRGPITGPAHRPTIAGSLLVHPCEAHYYITDGVVLWCE